MDAYSEHIPVMIDEVMRWVDPKPGGFYMDATLGLGGHAARLMELTGGEARLLGLDRDRLRIRNRINERVNDIAVFTDQVRLGAEMVVNNERLLTGENQRFSAGESSLFLVNAREVPLIDARIRQVDLEARLRKAYFALDHEAGTLWQAWRR